MGLTVEAPAAVAGTLLKVAVLLEAGTSPIAAWTHVAESGDAAAERIAARLAGDASVPEVLEAQHGGTWREVGAAWEIATTVGAPLAPSLRGIALALRDAQEAMDDVRIALAEPASTARLMTWLPVFGVVVGLALGFDVLGVLFTNAIGIACLLAGVGLLALARWWTARLVRAAQPPAGVPGIHAELTAIALGGGASIERARALVRDADTGAHLDPEHTESILELSRRAGVPAVDLLRAAAVQQRHDARTAGRMRAARLGGRLLLPLGVCTLPAFVCLGVAPMLVAVLSSTSLPSLP